MEEYSTSCIVLIPDDSAGEEHMTLVFFSETETGMAETFQTSLTKSLARMWHTVEATVVSHDQFGADREVSVAALTGQELYTMRSFIEPYALSQWGFRPHITSNGAPLRQIGSRVRFNRIGLWYANQHNNWRLGTAEPCAV